MSRDPHTGVSGGPVSLTISGTSALLLSRLAEATGAAADPGQVLMQALGLLDLAVKAKRDGKRLAFYDPESGDLSDVAF
jgi:hypothetical protein